jgi:SpoVK/Ycf46/Vps4 family AAA+-type ATPase
MKEIEHDFDDEDFENLAENTDKYSGSDIEVVVS